MRKNWGGLATLVKSAPDDVQEHQEQQDRANMEVVLTAGLGLTATTGTLPPAPPAALHGKFVAVKRPETKAEEAVVHNGVARQDQRTKLVAAEVVIASESFAVGDIVYFKPEALRTQGTSTLILPAHGTEPEVVFVWMPEAAVIGSRRVGVQSVKMCWHKQPWPPLAQAVPVPMTQPATWPPTQPGITWTCHNDVKN